jgi:hypothetical protein
MFAGTIIAPLGASRTPGLDMAAGQFADIFQPGHVKAHG